MRLRRKAFMGGFAGFVFERTLTTTSNYNARAQAVAAGWDGVLPIVVRLTVPAGVTISGDNAVIFSGSWPAGSALFLNVDAGASILGSGGYGGGGGSGPGGGGPGSPGSNGGTAVFTNHPLTINNLGKIAGGGGGGGGGAGAFTKGTSGNPDAFADGGGGGGGAGSPAGAPGGSTLYGGGGGASYTSNPPGGAVATSGAGGSGGSPGAAGQPGGNTPNSNGGAGGLAGAYIYGAALTTWTNTGTRLGRAI